MNEPIFYDAAGEQALCWNYHYNVGRNSSPQILKFDTTLENPDLQALKRSVEWLARRHDSLRTCFRMEDGRLRQYVLPYSEQHFSPLYYDVSDERDREGIVKRVTAILDEGMEVFKDLSTAPLWRSYLFKVSASTYYFCFKIHHIISDVWSQALIYKELRSFYEQFLAGRMPSEEPLKMQLKDYSEWQRQWRTDNKAAAAAYWVNKLSGCGLEGNGSGEADHARLSHALDTIRPAYISYHIDGEAYAGLERLASRYRSGMLAVVLVSLRLLFLQLKGKDKILISMPVASRFLPGMESIIGFLMGGIHMFQAVRPASTIHEMVRDCYTEFLESCRYVIFDHDELGLDKDLRLYCDVSVNFLSRAMTGGKMQGDGAPGGHQPLAGGCYYPLSYHLAEYEHGLYCSWLYNPGVYPASCIDNIMQVHKRLLAGMCKASQSTVGELIC